MACESCWQTLSFPAGDLFLCHSTMPPSLFGVACRERVSPFGEFSVAAILERYRGIALEVEDMTTAVDYLQSKGIAIALEPVDLGDSFRGEIRDSDGLILELRQWK